MTPGFVIGPHLTPPPPFETAEELMHIASGDTNDWVVVPAAAAAAGVMGSKLLKKAQRKPADESVYLDWDSIK